MADMRGSLTANTVAVVTIEGDHDDVEVTNTTGSAAIYYTLGNVADVQFNVNQVGLSSYTLDRFTVGGWERPGGVVTVSRVGGNGADSLTGDIHLAALHIRRES